MQPVAEYLLTALPVNPMIPAVSLGDWLVALHVLSAFAWVAGIVLFWILVVAVRRRDTPEGRSA